MTPCPECGPVEHQPIREDDAHCTCGGWLRCDCPCHKDEEAQR